MLLLCLQYAPIDTPLFSIARQLSRIEDLSHVLAWTPLIDEEAVVNRTKQSPTIVSFHRLLV